jgi:hypothetical protein
LLHCLLCARADIEQLTLQPFVHRDLPLLETLHRGLLE